MKKMCVTCGQEFDTKYPNVVFCSHDYYKNRETDEGCGPIDKVLSEILDEPTENPSK